MSVRVFLTVSNAEEVEVEEPVAIENSITHEQLVWTYVLEWCESRGKGVDAINPEDLDGTPSYYYFQFKPGTFKHYGTKYDLLHPELNNSELFFYMEDYMLTRSIVEHMINDEDVVWNHEFPGCTKIHGIPPGV